MALSRVICIGASLTLDSFDRDPAPPFPGGFCEFPKGLPAEPVDPPVLVYCQRSNLSFVFIGFYTGATPDAGSGRLRLAPADFVRFQRPVRAHSPGFSDDVGFGPSFNYVDREFFEAVREVGTVDSRAAAMVNVRTVGQLRDALQGLSDDAPVALVLPANTPVDANYDTIRGLSFRQERTAGPSLAILTTPVSSRWQT